MQATIVTDRKSAGEIELPYDLVSFRTEIIIESIAMPGLCGDVMTLLFLHLFPLQDMTIIKYLVVNHQLVVLVLNIM